MEKGIETGLSPESAERESKIILHFLRHGEKEKGVEGPDVTARLTSKGRAQSVEKARTYKADVNQSVAFGSPRVRARETAALAMAGERDSITGDETFYELAAKLNKGTGKKYGSKILADSRLDFIYDPNAGLGKEIEDHYAKGEMLKFLVEESDRRAVELGDVEAGSYSIQAAGIAQIIKKYATVSGRWHELVNDDSKKYTQTMERFLGTHQGIPESFLAKVVEKVKGVKERTRFVEALKNAGFDLTEGYDVEIVEKSANEEPLVRVRYEKKDKDGKELFAFDEIVPAEMIEEIIKEGKRGK